MSMSRFASSEDYWKARCEQLYKDARRYRKLRNLALSDSSLEAAVAIGQFDYMATAECFDDAVDALNDAQHLKQAASDS